MIIEACELLEIDLLVSLGDHHRAWLIDSIDSVKESSSITTMDKMLSMDHRPRVCHNLAIALYSFHDHTAVA